jgi:IstB-like ATP binding protein
MPRRGRHRNPAVCRCAASTGTGKTHLAIAIARSCIRAGKHGRFYNTVDLVNRLEAEARGGRQGRIAEYLTRRDFVQDLPYGTAKPFFRARRRMAAFVTSRPTQDRITAGANESGRRRSAPLELGNFAIPPPAPPPCRKEGRSARP